MPDEFRSVQVNSVAPNKSRGIIWINNEPVITTYLYMGHQASMY